MPKTIIPRRQFLQGCSAAIASMAGAKLTNLAFAKQDNPTDTLVVVFLRGAADVLNMVVPHGEEAYYQLRPSLGIARPDDLRKKKEEKRHFLKELF